LRAHAEDLARIPSTEPMTSIMPAAGFGSIRTRPNGLIATASTESSCLAAAQRDQLGADLKYADLIGQHLDCWFVRAAHKRILIRKAGVVRYQR
jgi:hypothetical protein